MAVSNSECRCGHTFAAHEHYRKGTSCAMCDCPKFRRPFPRLIGKLVGR
ncbi:hypothetical protein I1A62_39135 [Rhodococcus sp. USK10]|nr:MULTISPECIES: hypothetical protein [Rhodococcus]QYB03116.1 hypothetical protein I1A62_39135 [Rhodococcus sp. USK10]